MIDSGAMRTAVLLGRQLVERVLTPVKHSLVGKDEIIDLLGICLCAGENLFMLGPPGTAKSALVHELARRLDGRVFDYLLTRFTEPNELFGPFDIRRLREGELVTNTQGMLPEADLVFLDELLNANSAILNSLLMALNERLFRRGRETRSLPMVMAVSASNRLPEDPALGALFDRFLVRVHCENVADEQLLSVLDAGWRLDMQYHQPAVGMSIEQIRQLQGSVGAVDLSGIRHVYSELILRLRRAGLVVSDRRAVKFQKLVAAGSLLCGRAVANMTDLWVLRYTWDNLEQREVLQEIVQQVVQQADASQMAAAHQRAVGADAPDPEMLMRELQRLGDRLGDASVSASERAVLLDQLGVLAGRCQWVEQEQPRLDLQQQLDALWQQHGP